MKTCNKCEEQVDTVFSYGECTECYYLEINEKIGPEYQTRNIRGEAKCPWCGEDQFDSWEYEESGQYQCGICENEFFLQKNITVTYSTERVGENWIEAEYLAK